MMSHPDLEALVREELSAADAAAARTHAASCEECQGELAWLEAERELFRRRREAQPTSPSPALWRAVEDRLATRRLRLGRIGIATAALAAAASLVFFLASGEREPQHGHASPRDAAGLATAQAGPDAAAVPRTELELALDRAEEEYRRAIAQLEADYQTRRASLDPAVVARLDARFAELHETIDEARAVAGDDPEGRVQVLQAYSRFVHSLQAEANALPEERP